MLKDEVEQSGCLSLSNNDLIFPKSFDEVKFQGQIWGHMRMINTNLVGNLHKESGNKGFSNVGIVLFGGEFSTSSWQSKSVHDT